jgi:hypothetical protein
LVLRLQPELYPEIAGLLATHSGDEDEYLGNTI